MPSRVFLGIGFFVAVMLIGALPAAPADTNTPDYVVVVRHVDVNRSPDQVWKRVGDYCAISDFLKMTCHYSSGSGGVGTVRVLNDTTVEVMVAQTPHSYTYWQTAGTMAATSYHGTVSVEPNGAGKSTITYTLFYNQAALASDADRAQQNARLNSRFQGALDTMKALAEGQR